MKNIAIIGAGSWGTTLAILLGEKGHTVKLWCRREELATEINNTKENKQYLSNARIPDTVIATHLIDEVARECDVFLLAVPSQFARETASLFADKLQENTQIIHVIKGLEEETGKLMSRVLEEVFKRDIAVLSGPNHAEEVAHNLPTATVIAAKDKTTAASLCDVFTTTHFKAYPHDDVIGVEICGVMKNIVAIAIGVCDGLQFGDNAKASITTLGLAEMSAIAKNFGAKRTTCFGLAGVGDLIATCYSKYSRNRSAGEKLAENKSLKEIKEEMHGMVAEGIRNTKAVYELCKKQNMEPPLVSHAYKVLYENMDLKQAIAELLDAV